MKLHAMKNEPQRQFHDLPDIIELLRRDSDNWSLDELKSMCERYGPLGIFFTIQPHIEP